MQITNSGSTIVRNGNLGSPGGLSPGGITYVNGMEDDSSNATTAQTQLSVNVRPQAEANADFPSSPPTIIDNGNYTFFPGGFVTNVVLSLNSGKIFTLDAQGDQNGQFYIRAPQIVFIDGLINLINGAQPDNIFWISDSNITVGTAGMTIAGVFIASSSITLSTNTTVQGRLYAQTGTITLLSNTINVPTSGPIPPTPCYLKGTQILTSTGYVRVEDLRLGDLIVTRGDISGTKCVNCVTQRKPIIWIGHFVVNERNPQTVPICIAKNAFGDQLPINDLYVSPDHNLILHGKLIPAIRLIGRKNIFRMRQCDKIEYYHIELPRHSIIISEGILAESYVDIHNRSIFKHSTLVTQRGTNKNIHH
jgi:hypothetical protein